MRLRVASVEMTIVVWDWEETRWRPRVTTIVWGMWKKPVVANKTGSLRGLPVYADWLVEIYSVAR
jgi:hypothetical protein